MNLCGNTSQVVGGCLVQEQSSPQTPPPPVYTFSESDVKGTRTSSRGTTTPLSRTPGSRLAGASPSPCLLNPITDEDWKESSSRMKNKTSVPKLPLSMVSKRLIQRLQSGYRLVMLSKQNEERNVIIRLNESQSVMYVLPESTEEQVKVDDLLADDKKGEDDTALEAIALITIAVSEFVHLDLEVPAEESDHPATFFSIVLDEKTGEQEHQSVMAFVASSPLDKESITSAISLLLESSDENPTPVLPRRMSLEPREGETSFMNESFSPVSLLEASASGSSRSCSLGEQGDELHPLDRTRVYLSTVSLQNMPKSTMAKEPRQKTPRDQGTETFIDVAEPLSPDSAMSMPMLDVSAESENVKPPLLERKLVRASHESLNLLLGPEDMVVVHGEDDAVGRSVWCVEDMCASALQDLAQTFQGMIELMDEGAMSGRPRLGPVEEQSKRVEVVNYIADALSAPSEPDEPHAGDDSFPKPPTLVRGTSVASRIHSHGRIRNRAHVFNGQSKRWSDLKKEMTFDSARQQSQKRLYTIHTTKSMDDIEQTRTGLKRERRPSMLDGLVNQFMEQFNLDAGSEEEEALYYDSDPEYSRPRRRANKGGRRAAEEVLMHVIDDNGEDDDTQPKNRLKIPRRLAGVKMEEGQICEVVDLIKSSTLTLLWHPDPTADQPCRKPVCVHAWIEQGTYLLDGSFVQPKFMWKAAVERDLATKRTLNLAFEKVDLLELSRIRDNFEADRETHPLAQRTSSFAIETRDKTHVFQAQTPSEMRHICFALKLLVARLASLLLTHDNRAVKEFFEPTDQLVPGKAPQLVKGSSCQGNKN